MSGNISVHGWDKDEVQARSSDAAQIELRRKNGAAQSGKAVNVEVFVVDNSDDERIKKNCQAYSDLELFVPRAASVHVQTRDGNIDIADIAVVVAGTQNGDINIERVSRAVEVATVGGCVSIKDSTGRASVTTIGGGVEVINLRPNAAADGFEAVTVSGDLNLAGVSHSQLNARTVTGDVHLTGPLAARGRYGFKTMSGDITLTLPDDSSFHLSAKVSNDGEIISDFPLTLVPDVTPPPASPVPPPAPTAPVSRVSAKSPAPVASPTVVVAAQPVSDVSPKNPTPAPASKPHASPVNVKVAPRISKVIVTAPVTVSVSGVTMRRVDAVCGGGDASIQVASFSGTLHLLKN
ncbi:MAG: DUF4097 family beta strand repeat-containing protein [Pyrinomonadaceae bacterium]|nr:DUF4097 family beta strand repeat-containing protein [Pyrinomonadaceae bacterium]